jgi:hypothetical protein
MLSREKIKRSTGQAVIGMTQAVLDLKVQEIRRPRKKDTRLEQKAQQDLQKYAEEQMKPLQDKYMKGVKDISKEQGYTYIFDIAAGGVVYYPESGSDITQAVKPRSVLHSLCQTLTKQVPEQASNQPEVNKYLKFFNHLKAIH